jgi:hypothetical protein
MGSAFKKVGVALVAAGITNVLFDFGKKSVQAAIDAEEMGSAFNVVFGNMADDVRAWAEETGNALGRSTQEIQRGALAFQELFGKALQPEQAAELSKQFAVLTQDLASFKNLSNEVAQQKLFSGLTGEAEPLRAVGVFLNETAVKAKAAELGLRGVNGVLTDQEKIVARAAIIQEQLSQASGDVERTSGSAANQIKTMNAAVEELQVAIGTQLLPALTPLITLTANLITKLAEAARAFNGAGESIANYVRGLEVLAGWIGRGASALQSFGNWLGWADEKMAAIGRRALALAGPISQVVTFIERLGARNAPGSGGPLGVTANAMLDMARQATAGGSAFANLQINAGGAAVSLGKIETAATRAGVAMRAANDEFEAPSIQDAGIARFEPNAALAAIGGRPLDEIEELEKAANRYVKSLKDAEEETKTTTVAIADTFAQMADRTLQALDRMVGAIRGGGFLDILSSVINFGIQLGGMGAFGSKIQSNILAGARANGGQVNAGRAYLVGERGPELFMPQAHGQIVANDNMRGGGMTINVDARGSSDPEAVRRQVQQGILEAAPSIVAAAEQRTISTLRRPRLAGVM